MRKPPKKWTPKGEGRKGIINPCKRLGAGAEEAQPGVTKWVKELKQAQKKVTRDAAGQRLAATYEAEKLKAIQKALAKAAKFRKAQGLNAEGNEPWNPSLTFDLSAPVHGYDTESSHD